MEVDKKYYALKTNVEHFGNVCVVNVNSLNGDLIVLFSVENYCDDYEVFIKLIEQHIRFYFDRQYYNDAYGAVRDVIIYIARQIYLTTKHNEVLYGATFSCVVGLLREQKFYLSRMGEYAVLQQQETSPGNNRLVNVFGQDGQSEKFLKTDNFHQLQPQALEIRANDEDVFLFAREKMLFPIFESAKGDVDVQDLQLDRNETDYVLFNFRNITTYKHENDSSFLKKLTTIEYFKNIPLWHIGLIGTVLLLIIISMVIFRIQDKIAPAENRIMQELDSVLIQDIEKLESEIDTLLILKKDSLGLSSDTAATFVVEDSDTHRGFDVTYVVEKKDNLYRLSKIFNVHMDTIVHINSIVDYTIFPGQNILIPVRKVHVVETSESLYEIKRKYNVSVEQLLKINKLDDVVIYDGMQLIIPYPNEN